MVKNFNINGLIEQLKRQLTFIDNANHHEIATLLMELKKKNMVWKGIPSGNRDYFVEGLRRYGEDKNADATKNYLVGKDGTKGAKNHLRQAWPHLGGFIAIKMEGGFTTGDSVMDEFVTGARAIESLDPLDLMELAREVKIVVEKCNKPRNFAGFLNGTRVILETYEKKMSDDAAARAYAEEKKGSLLKLMQRSFLTNLIGAVARGVFS